MNTVPYKGENWPVSPAWAEKHLAGAFAGLVAWETGLHADSTTPFDPERPRLWDRLWGLLRKSDEVFAQRTAGMSHKEVGALMVHAAGCTEEVKVKLLAMDPAKLLEDLGLTPADVAELKADPQLTAKARAIVETLSPEELLELRAVEAHIIVRNRVDHLLGRELAEFDIQFIDHAHGQGSVLANCGCDLLAVLDDDKLARTHAGEEGLKFMHAHYPRKLCNRHAHLQAVVAGVGRWHNLPLADRLTHVHETIFADQEAQSDAAAA